MTALVPNATTKTRRHEERTKKKTKNLEDVMLKIPSHLSDELEDLIHRTIGCCITVHRTLGPGLLEAIYCRAICLELAAANISFEAQKRYPVFYRGQLLSYQRLDLIVEEQLVLEIKSVEQLNQLHRSQVLSYLRVSKLAAGLLMNFNVPVLQDGLRRIVL
jgi:GxxExxY protein